jgi:hypothetical protein
VLLPVVSGSVTVFTGKPAAVRSASLTRSFPVGTPFLSFWGGNSGSTSARNMVIFAPAAPAKHAAMSPVSAFDAAFTRTLVMGCPRNRTPAAAARPIWGEIASQ